MTSMTYEEALDRVKLAVDTVRDPQTRQATFERAILEVMIELEILKADEDGNYTAGRR